MVVTVVVTTHTTIIETSAHPTSATSSHRPALSTTAEIASIKSSPISATTTSSHKVLVAPSSVSTPYANPADAMSSSTTSSDSGKIESMKSWVDSNKNRAILGLCVTIGVLVAIALGIVAFVLLRRRWREKKKIERIETMDRKYAARQDEEKAREETAQMWNGLHDKNEARANTAQKSVYDNVPPYLPPGAAPSQRPGSMYPSYPSQGSARTPGSEQFLPPGPQAMRQQKVGMMHGNVGSIQPSGLDQLLPPPAPQAMQQQSVGVGMQGNGCSAQISGSGHYFGSGPRAMRQPQVWAAVHGGGGNDI